MVTVKLKCNPNISIPKYQTHGSAGMDLCAYLPEKSIILKSGEFQRIKTGLFIQLPVGYEAQIRPRSGLALKNGITVLNSPGTIDSDYRGEIGVILINHSNIDFEIKSGDRICQMVISKYETVNFEIVVDLDKSERNSGGFGHTGK
ncbi:MAG: dUTP diphosphatase [Salinivirgaceae bacterium]|nr:dUTP diphosphatase [Salinivirgaceae bacterium]